MFGLKSLIRTSAILLMGVSLTASVTACGEKPKSKFAAVKPGDMPVGGEWTGVYYSQTYGYLHLIKEGDTVSGRWRTDAGDKWGELSGKVTGDLLKYEWTEHRIGMVGKSADTNGRGFFQYSIPKEGESHVIKGQWGLNQDETGQTWEAVKQANMLPDLDSVMPDELERRGTQSEGGWDSSEAPASGSGGNDDGEPALE